MAVEPEDLFEIVTTLRQAGVREQQIALAVGLTHSAYRSQLHHHRRRGPGWRLPDPAPQGSRRLEDSVTALLVALRANKKLSARDALVVAAAGPSADAMFEAAETLVRHRLAEAADLDSFALVVGADLSLAA
jgi:hypothetical protein